MIENDRYLESKKEEFDEAIERGYWVGAAAVIDELSGKGFKNEAIWLKSELKKETDEEMFQENAEQRALWLNDHGRTESDVMRDDVGEYVHAEGEERMEKTYIPDFNF